MIQARPFLSQCHYCGQRLTRRGVVRTRDHIVPRAMGGPAAEDNVVSACTPCNTLKGDMRSSCDCDRCTRAWTKYGPVGWPNLERRRVPAPLPDWRP